MLLKMGRLPKFDWLRGSLIFLCVISVGLMIAAQTSIFFTVTYYGGVLVFNPTHKILRYNLWDAIAALWSERSFPLAIGLFLLSGLWPYVKTAALVMALSPLRGLLSNRNQYRLTTALYYYGKWCYLDICIVASVLLTVQVFLRSAIVLITVDTTADIGVYFYLASAILSQVISMVYHKYFQQTLDDMHYRKRLVSEKKREAHIKAEEGAHHRMEMAYRTSAELRRDRCECEEPLTKGTVDQDHICLRCKGGVFTDTELQETEEYIKERAALVFHRLTDEERLKRTIASWERLKNSLEMQNQNERTIKALAYAAKGKQLLMLANGVEEPRYDSVTKSTQGSSDYSLSGENKKNQENCKNQENLDNYQNDQNRGYNKSISNTNSLPPFSVINTTLLTTQNNASLPIYKASATNEGIAISKDSLSANKLVLEVADNMSDVLVSNDVGVFRSNVNNNTRDNEPSNSHDTFVTALSISNISILDGQRELGDRDHAQNLLTHDSSLQNGLNFPRNSINNSKSTISQRKSLLSFRLSFNKPTYSTSYTESIEEDGQWSPHNHNVTHLNYKEPISLLTKDSSLPSELRSDVQYEENRKSIQLDHDNHINSQKTQKTANSEENKENAHKLTKTENQGIFDGVSENGNNDSINKGMVRNGEISKNTGLLTSNPLRQSWLTHQTSNPMSSFNSSYTSTIFGDHMLHNTLQHQHSTNTNTNTNTNNNTNNNTNTNTNTNNPNNIKNTNNAEMSSTSGSQDTDNSSMTAYSQAYIKDNSNLQHYINAHTMTSLANIEMMKYNISQHSSIDSYTHSDQDTADNGYSSHFTPKQRKASNGNDNSDIELMKYKPRHFTPKRRNNPNNTNTNKNTLISEKQHDAIDVLLSPTNVLKREASTSYESDSEDEKIPLPPVNSIAYYHDQVNVVCIQDVRPYRALLQHIDIEVSQDILVSPSLLRDLDDYVFREEVLDYGARLMLTDEAKEQDNFESDYGVHMYLPEADRPKALAELKERKIIMYLQQLEEDQRIRDIKLEDQQKKRFKGINGLFAKNALPDNTDKIQALKRALYNRQNHRLNSKNKQNSTQLSSTEPNTQIDPLSLPRASLHSKTTPSSKKQHQQTYTLDKHDKRNQKLRQGEEEVMLGEYDWSQDDEEDEFIVQSHRNASKSHSHVDIVLDQEEECKMVEDEFKLDPDSVDENIQEFSSLEGYRSSLEIVANNDIPVQITIHDDSDIGDSENHTNSNSNSNTISVKNRDHLNYKKSQGKDMNDDCVHYKFNPAFEEEKTPSRHEMLKSGRYTGHTENRLKCDEEVDDYGKNTRELLEDLDDDILEAKSHLQQRHSLMSTGSLFSPPNKPSNTNGKEVQKSSEHSINNGKSTDKPEIQYFSVTPLHNTSKDFKNARIEPKPLPQELALSLIPPQLNLYDIEVTDQLMHFLTNHQKQRIEVMLGRHLKRFKLAALGGAAMASAMIISLFLPLFLMEIQFVKKIEATLTFTLSDYAQSIVKQWSAAQNFPLALFMIMLAMVIPLIHSCCLLLSILLRILIIKQVGKHSLANNLRFLSFIHSCYIYLTPWCVIDILAITIAVLTYELPPIVARYGENKLTFYMEHQPGLYVMMVSSLIYMLAQYHMDKYLRLPAFLITPAHEMQLPQVAFQPRNYEAHINEYKVKDEEDGINHDYQDNSSKHLNIDENIMPTQYKRSIAVVKSGSHSYTPTVLHTFRDTHPPSRPSRRCMSGSSRKDLCENSTDSNNECKRGCLDQCDCTTSDSDGYLNEKTEEASVTSTSTTVYLPTNNILPRNNSYFSNYSNSSKRKITLHEDFNDEELEEAQEQLTVEGDRIHEGLSTSTGDQRGSIEMYPLIVDN